MAKVKKDNIAQRHIQEAFSSEIVELKKLNQETAKAIPELQQTIEDFKDFRERPFKVDTSDLKKEVAEMVSKVQKVSQEASDKLTDRISVPSWVYITTIVLSALFSLAGFYAYHLSEKYNELSDKHENMKGFTLKYKDFIEDDPARLKEYREWEKSLDQ